MRRCYCRERETVLPEYEYVALLLPEYAALLLPEYAALLLPEYVALLLS